MRRKIRVSLFLPHLGTRAIHVLMAEFELVTQALWTDPGDQSGWIYHRWLIGTSASPFHNIIMKLTTRST